MTDIEAIKDIKENILPCVGGKSLVFAISALEKQIPQKISIEGYCGFVDYICPVCGNDIDLNKKHNYCSNCGQMLEK